MGYRCGGDNVGFSNYISGEPSMWKTKREVSAMLLRIDYRSGKLFLA